MSTNPAQRDESAQERGAPRRSRRATLRLGLYKRAVAVFLGSLVLLIVVSPFAEKLADPGLLEGALLTTVLVCGVLAVGGRRRTLMLAALLGLPALGAKWLNHFRPDLIAPGIYLVLGVLLLILVTVQLLRFILSAPRVDAEVLSAGIATYLVLAIMWALLYLLAASLVPDAFVLAQNASASRSFDGFNALYFSFITLCTVGYGDIVPAAPVVRMLAMLEGFMGVLYMSVLIARLVTLYSDKRE